MGPIKQVGGIIWRDGKILLGKRASDRTFYPNVWDIIGGHCGAGETLEQALARELKEEIGVTPTGFKHIRVLNYAPTSPSDEYELHIYIVTDWLGSPSNLSPREHSLLAWFEIGEACSLELADSSFPEIFRGLEGQAKVS